MLKLIVSNEPRRPMLSANERSARSTQSAHIKNAEIFREKVRRTYWYRSMSRIEPIKILF